MMGPWPATSLPPGKHSSGAAIPPKKPRHPQVEGTIPNHPVIVAAIRGPSCRSNGIGTVHLRYRRPMLGDERKPRFSCPPS
jgi:hypothetical protein